VSKKKKHHLQHRGIPFPPQLARNVVPVRSVVIDPASLKDLPVTYQALIDFYAPQKDANLYLLRKETYRRIEKVTGRPLICYVAKTRNLAQGVPVQIDDSDLTGFSDLTHSVQGEAVDIFFVSNGGSAETAERIVRLLRGRFKTIRFIVPANAYSAATLICFAGDEILMDTIATLGPIDPQINGIPARAILRAFESIEARLKEEGPRALTAFMPLLSKYDLHMLEICKSALDLSKELARTWLSAYMLKCGADDPRIEMIVNFFSSYDIHKSHGRSIDREKAREKGVEKVRNLEEIPELVNLVRSLLNQYELWFDKTPFFKMFENAHGINWGRQSQTITLQLPLSGSPGLPAPQPGPPERSS
jgi:hypothetical protein